MQHHVFTFNFSQFYIENEADNFRLRVFGYNGTAGDRFPDLDRNNMQFTTMDRDNDLFLYVVFALSSFRKVFFILLIKVLRRFNRCCTMLCVCHTTPKQKLFCLHVFRQAGSPQRVNCLATWYV